MNYKTNKLLGEPIGDPFSGPAYYGKPWLSTRPGYRDFVKDILSFQSNAGQDSRDLYAKDPERIFLGANTPLESEVWGTVLGKKYEPTVDMFGGTTSHNSETANARGVSTGPGEAMHSIARAITMFFAGGALGDAMGGGEAAAGTEGLGADTSGVLSGSETAPMDIPAGETTLAEGQAGVSTSGSESLAGNTGSGTMSGNVGGDTLTAPGSDMSQAVADNATGSGASTANTTAGEQAFTQGATTPAKGLIQSSLDFVKANPLATVGAGQLVSGVVSGIGNNMTQNQIADKKAQSDRELLAQKTREEAAALEARRRFIQSGSYFGASVPMRAAPQQQLRRPDGSLVYTPNGLIATAMR